VVEGGGAVRGGRGGERVRGEGAFREVRKVTMPSASSSSSLGVVALPVVVMVVMMVVGEELIVA